MKEFLSLTWILHSKILKWCTVSALHLGVLDRLPSYGLKGVIIEKSLYGGDEWSLDGAAQAPGSEHVQHRIESAFDVNKEQGNVYGRIYFCWHMSSPCYGVNEPTHKVRHPAGDEEKHGYEKNVVHPGHLACHWRGRWGRCEGHHPLDSEHNCKVASQEHQQGYQKSCSCLYNKQAHGEISTLLTIECPFVFLQVGEVKVRGRQSCCNEPQEAAGDRDRPGGPS